MKRAESGIGKRSFRWAALIAMMALLLANGAYGQSGSGSGRGGSCTVTRLRFRIATADDDLRGGKDNLNIIIYFTNGQRQTASNVNKSQNWPNDSVNMVEVALDRPIPPNELHAFRLIHVPDSSFSVNVGELLTPAAPIALAEGLLQSPDKWNMADLKIAALGEGVGARVASHGYHSFTASNPDLTIYACISPNICGSGTPTSASNTLGKLNPGTRSLQSVNSIGSKYGKEAMAPSTIQPVAKAGSPQLQKNRLIQQALAHTVQIGPRASAPGGNDSYSTILAIIKRQSLASRSLLMSGVRPPNENRTPTGGSGGANAGGTLLSGGSKVALSPQPYPPKGSQPMLGASQTMSAPGNSSGTSTAASGTSSANTQHFNLVPGTPANSLTPTNGATAHQAPGGRQPLPLGMRAPGPLTTICRSGIATVDGGASGVWFNPVAGEDGRFLIQGCGFGNAPGEVYLSGVQFVPVHARVMVQRLGTPTSPDQVYFQIPPNGWTDRQIVAQIDPNAGGLYDTNNVTLNVKTAGGQIYQATGMNFLAAREDQVLKKLVRTTYPTGADSCYGQTLSECLIPGINLAIVNASLGPLTPQVESPTQYWLTPGESIAAVRGVIYLNATDNYAVNFPSGTDRYQFNFAPGFQLDPNNGVQLSHASIDVSHCQSLGGVYSHSGNWGVSYTSTSSFQVQWEEEACSPSSATAKNPQGIGVTNGYAGFSAYELEITVLGPRGVNPFASGNVNRLAIKQLQPVQMLRKN